MNNIIETNLPDTQLYQETAVKIYDRFPSPDFGPVLRFIQKKKPIPGISFDVGCGTGSLIGFLEKSGWNAQGCDPSLDMLNYAKKKLDKDDLSNSNAINFEVIKNVDLITCTFDVLNHLDSLDEVKQFFIRAYNNLNQGGILIFDTVTPNDIKYNWPRYAHVEDLGDIFIVIRGKTIEERIGRLYYDFFVKDASGSYKRHTEIHTLRALPLQWCMETLREIGYTNIDCVDAMDLNEKSEKSVRWLFSAQRR